MNLKRCLFFHLILPVLCLATVPCAKGASRLNTHPKIVIIEFHGLKKEIIKNNLNDLPYFKELIQGPANKQANIYIPQVFTTIPAASVPACTSMYTGLYPQQTGVVSTIWFDRETTKIRTMISYFQQRINRILIGNNIKTIFNYVGEAGKTSLSAMLMIDKGTDVSLKTGIFFWGNASVVGLARYGRWLPDPWYMDYKTISGLLTGHVFAYHKSLKGVLDKKGTLPDLTVVQLLGTDIYSHYPEKELIQRNASMDDIQAHYTQHILDPLMGRLMHFLKSNGVYSQTMFILVSQQGTIKIQKHIPDQAVADSLKDTFKLPNLITSNREANAIIMPGACTKEIYLKNRETGDWLDPPRLLLDVKQAVDLLVDHPDIQEGLNEIVIRRYPGEREDAAVMNQQWWAFEWQDYRKGPRMDIDFIQALYSLEEMARRFELKQYISESLNRQYTRRTAPDIKLINKKGIYFERDLNKYGHHGSYYPDDTVVSFWLAGPGLSAVVSGRHTIKTAASTLDLIPIAMRLLEIPAPVGLEGNNPLDTLPLK
ncbi:MAG: alkaline phosphatase family protein [Desulfobacterales bacterium]|nr:MAG: alkaline phosphatase family protein [Desulfobacterales bacterium]